MASPYVFSNYALQYLTSSAGTRYRIYAATYNPVQIFSISQDYLIDEYGQPMNVDSMDLLANLQPPFMPQANLGPNRIGFVDETLLFDGSRSTQRNNLPAINHQWSATGNPTVTTYNALGDGDQAGCVWSDPGIYTVSLTVQDRFGGTHTGTRQVWIYADRESAPRGIVGLGALTGSISSGGWNAQFTVSQPDLHVLLPDALPIGSYQPFVLMCETEYEVAPGNWVPATIGQYGAPVPGQSYIDPRIIFDGYIQTGTATQDSDHDTVSFTVQTADMILQSPGIHNIGYYNTVYNSRHANGTPINQKPNADGWKGQLVSDFTSEDLYRSLITGYTDSSGMFHGGHSNVGQFHDLVIWRDFLPLPTDSSQLYYLTYTHLTANEGTLWAACQQVAQNEFASIWCERDGSICIGPTYSMRGYELMNTPTLYPRMALSQILASGELNNDKTKSAQLATLLNLFGPNPLPVPKDFAWSAERDLSALIGPPIVAHISDSPIYDIAGSPPDNAGLFPWVLQNWPQDLSIRPITTTVTENYTSRTAFVKLVATLVDGKTVWAAWYPTTTFDVSGLMQNVTPAGSWDVESSLLLADITAKSQSALSWQYLWEMARRTYLAHNAQYTVDCTLPMATWPRLHDVFLYTRQNVTTGPKLSAMPFMISDITFNISIDDTHWATDIKGAPITSYNIGPVIVPPLPAPK